MTVAAEGVTLLNAAWNLARFASNIFDSCARLADDFRLDLANSNRKAVESQRFTSSVEAGLERLWIGDYPAEIEWEEVDEDEDEYLYVEGEED